MNKAPDVVKLEKAGMKKMRELLEWMECIEEKRQAKKVLHKLKDIIVIVLFATLANVDGFSMKKKRFVISLNPPGFLDQVLSF